MFTLAVLLPAYQLGGRCGCACQHPPARTALRMQMQETPKIDSQDTYNVMMRALMETNNSLTDEISTHYHMVDYGFLQNLEKARETATDDKLARIEKIKDAVNTEMRLRIETATKTLKDIVQSPSPVIMEGKIAGLARQGKIDDALMTLLEANVQQAEQAGEAGKGALQVLSKLKSRVRDELDTKHAPPIALLRRLFRMDSKPARVALLKEKLAPKSATKVLLVSAQDGGKEEEKDLKPDVDPRDLAKAIEQLKFRFGNVDENYDTGFVAKVDMVATEAEEVTLELAGGQELSARDQQDLMWEKGSVSVWDLEAVEEKAREEGGVAVWEEEAQQQFARDAEQRQQGILRDMGQQ